MVRTALRVLVRDHHPLGDTVSALNDILMAETPVGWFVTLFYGLVEPRTHDLRYISAGHCPALLCRADGGEELLEPTGPALGIFDGRAFPEGVASLEPGDRLVCATDGVIDAVRVQDLQERYDWMAGVVRRHDGRSASLIAQSLVEGAVKAAEGGHKDDVTAVVLQRAAGPA
jgi:sigma-B regulation protein RsbU (phosphoserine phosphatase)